MKTTLILALAVLAFASPTAVWAGQDCCAAKAAAPAAEQPPQAPLQKILDNLQKNAVELTSCTAKLTYLVIQDPDLLDSQTTRKGTLHYLKSDGRSQVKIQFDTVQQDDFDEEKRLEIYLFDGVWLTKIDYTLEQVDRLQQAPEDKPLDAFDFLTHHFPLVGFSGGKDLETEFDIQLTEPTENEQNMSHLILNVKPDSRYSKDYKTIDFWIDDTTYLPRRVRTLAMQGDIYNIDFDDVQTNKKIEKTVFVLDAPKHFQKTIETLKQQPLSKGENQDG